ncbi:unnamed protein product [Adineta ricciae]|uniref:Uncharacterized protein n=1 Tax=Adineta ricciae TaxID=249248 RepID=A0A814Z3S8_ADIRI|nr:unnamed protein product [Adineta ricciae]
MLNSVERISQIIPKLKQQLLFLEEREKLFRQIEDGSISCDGSLSNTSVISKTSALSLLNAQAPSGLSISSQSSPSAHLSNANLATTMSTNSSMVDQTIAAATAAAAADALPSLPDTYEIPALPKALLKDIEVGNLKTFGSHCQGRQILIDAVVHDLIENYDLLYLSKTQYNTVGSAVVRCLRLPLTPENVVNALQTKFKRTRSDHSNNSLVQEFRLKYANPGSGRPVKQKIGSVAERDRHKQMVIMHGDNEISDEIQLKAVQLCDFDRLDVDTKLRLWRETFGFRRQAVRDQSTSDIMKKFPAYNEPHLVFEEIKMLVDLDLRKEVRRQVPILLDKLVETNSFIADVPPIRLIKILCRKFGETIQHIFCEKEAPTPYPTLVSIDDVIHIYVDFCPILSTHSPDDALGLLIGMYSVFELSFDKKSRTIRFLYCVLHGDKQFLSNSIRVLIKEKNIEIHRERLQPPSVSPHSISTNATILSTESQIQSRIVTNSSSQSTDEHNSALIDQSTEPDISTHSHSIVDVACVTDEFNHNNDDVMRSDCSSKLQGRKRRKRKQVSNEEEQDATLMSNAGQKPVESSQSRLPLANMTNSSVTLRQSKRRRQI